MDFTSEHHLDDGVLERDFTLGDVPGVLWTRGPGPAPLLLIGHPGGSSKRLPRLVARARRYVSAHGFAVAALDAPGCGDRPRSPADEDVRARLRAAAAAGEPIADLLDSLVVPLVEAAVPEAQAALDALLGLPGIGHRAGYEGMNPLGIALAAREPRISAVVLLATSVPDSLHEEARAVTVPVQLLLPWDDERGDRQRGLDLFDAFGSREKTLHANLGGHTGTPWFEVDEAGRFLARHLT